MLWVAPAEKDVATDRLESRLWAEAGQPRSNLYTHRQLQRFIFR